MTSQADEPADDELPAARDAALGRFPEQVLEWLRTHPKRWLSGLVVVTVAVVGFAVWTDSGDNEAEARVREYLEAVRAADLDKAEGMLESRDSNAEQLMTPDALDTKWTIQLVESENFSRKSLSAEANVVLKGRNGQEAAFDFELRRPDLESSEPFEITNGYISLKMLEDRHQHLRINGQPVVDDEEEGYDEDVRLYPGVYRFGHALEDVLDVDWQQRLLAGGSYTVDGSGQDVEPSGLLAEPWSFSADGETRAQELINAHIDDCAEKNEALETSCPFGVDKMTSGDHRNVRGDELDDLEWEVEEYPEVTVVESQGQFRYVDRSRGLVRLTATSETDGGTVDIDTQCEMRTTSLHVTAGDDGELTVDIFGNDSGSMWSTC